MVVHLDSRRVEKTAVWMVWRTVDVKVVKKDVTKVESLAVKMVRKMVVDLVSTRAALMVVKLVVLMVV